MPKFESDQIQSWLQLLCQMLPGSCQAVVIQGSDSISSPIAVWPATNKAQDDVITAARLASSQNKRVTTTLSLGQDNNSTVETIIAMLLVQPDELNATLAVQVNIKPSQQSVVMQILQWGDEWLGLMWRSHQCENPVSKVFLVEISLPPDLSKSYMGHRIYVRFIHPKETLNKQLIRKFNQFLLQPPFNSGRLVQA